jgi:PKD repeat protein
MFVVWCMVACSSRPSREDPPDPAPQAARPPASSGVSGGDGSGGTGGARAIAPAGLAPQPEPTDDPGGQDTGTASEEKPPLAARLTVDVEEGEYPFAVSFDASGSDLGTGAVRYEWSFGDGAAATGESTRVHTYVGEGEFDAVLTLVDEGTGQASTVEVTIDVDTPDCPNEEPPVVWGTIDDDLDDVSGIAASRMASGLYWLHQDDDDDLVVVDSSGTTLSEHELTEDFDDMEDIAVLVDPTTGTSTMFVADIGDNDLVRDEVAVLVVEEPDPWTDSVLDPLRIELTYPDGPHDAETLLVDPFTMDLFVVTKNQDGDQSVYVKRAPHEDEGPFELEDLGSFSELPKATGGDVSADGSRIVVRDYSNTARIWFRDGYEPFEEAFEEDSCDIEIYDDSRGEGAAFTDDGSGIVTVSEGDDVSLYHIEL